MTAADLQTLAAIENSSFPDPSWKSEDFSKYDCTVAEIDDQIAGFVVARCVSAATDGAPAEREILNLAVATEFRRMGVASRLLEHERRYGATLFLEVRASNAAALHLYRKVGFTKLSIRRNYYNSPAESAIVMRMK